MCHLNMKSKVEFQNQWSKKMYFMDCETFNDTYDIHTYEYVRNSHMARLERHSTSVNVMKSSIHERKCCANHS